MERMAKTTSPKGSRFPAPWLRMSHAACAAKGSTAHLHDRSGSTYARHAASTHMTGMPTEKYTGESHASLLPDTSDTTTQTSTPIATAMP